MRGSITTIVKNHLTRLHQRVSLRAQSNCYTFSRIWGSTTSISKRRNKFLSNLNIKGFYIPLERDAEYEDANNKYSKSIQRRSRE